MQITITITANKDDGTPINSHTTEELEKALAENREVTIEAWLADAKRSLRKIAESIAESIESAVERSE